MVTGPIITLFLVFIGTMDVLMIVSTFTRAYTAWSEWEEYHALRTVVQDMFLIMNQRGGPYITTNDSSYLQYVFADAMVRHV
jgi:hypothetical protein